MTKRAKTSEITKVNAVVVLSGGQDSATALALAVKKHGADKVAAITFRYGQNHSLEVRFARALARRFKIAQYKVVKMAFMGELAESSLLKPGAEITKKKGASCPSTVVEGRNAFFLQAAAVWAKTLSAHEVWTGVSEADFSGYPDCRATFIRAQERSASLALDFRIKIVTPFMHCTKADEWQMADELGILDVIDNHTLTCYRAVPGDGCGLCPACKLRRRGKKEYLKRRK
ncbi:MAG: 7-cyano-7-deazaguanine synthase QueC [Kiritimatiellae bacterium]|nr:7-cyano-7-deazaguanine synthase QueC [Kiritimatiellia bacterium]